jgi:hypothetical protein
VPCPASDALQELHLDANKFTGTVPSCLFRKPALEQLLLSSNFRPGSPTALKRPAHSPQ